jgi:hypothetical protein
MLGGRLPVVSSAGVIPVPALSAEGRPATQAGKLHGRHDSRVTASTESARFAQ